MSKIPIFLSPSNEEWLENQAKSRAFLSKSDMVNDLMDRARAEQSERDWVRGCLDRAEQRGFTELTPAELLEKAQARVFGKL